MIGVLVGDLGNAYHAQLARVVERALFRAGYTALFCNIEGDEELAIAGVDALLEQRVAGFLLLALDRAHAPAAGVAAPHRRPDRHHRPAAGVDRLGRPP